VIVVQPSIAGPKDFVFTIDTSISAGAADFTIPTYGTGYNYDVDCDNDGVFEALNQTATFTCQYSTNGIKTLLIRDNSDDGSGFPRFRFDEFGQAAELIQLNQWGIGFWDTMESAFDSASNLIISATDSPNLSEVSSTAQMFSGAVLADPNTTNWDTSNITDMSNMFAFANSANPDTTNWDISNVTTMAFMFNGVTLPTASYDAILLNFSSQQFQQGVIFHGGNSMYCDITSHNYLTALSTGGWLISDGGLDPNCVDPSSDFMIQIDTSIPGGTIGNRFEIPTSGPGYNYNIDCDDANPQTNTATAQTGRYTCTYINSGIYTIRIEDNVGDGSGFPRFAFNGVGDKNKIIDVLQWGTGKWTSMQSAFFGAINMTVTATDVPNLSLVTSLRSMFHGAVLADPETNDWNTSNVTDMLNMFSNADSADPNTSNWDTSGVTLMAGMFSGAELANPDTSSWDTSNVTNMSYMFSGASVANPDTSSWDITSITSMEGMFQNVTLPTDSYDAILLNFSFQTVQPGILFSGGNSMYCVTFAHDDLTSSDGWVITDSGIDPLCDDLIFKDSFEVSVVTFAANKKLFTYDFEQLENVKLDRFQQLIAVGLDSYDTAVVEFHVRKIGDQLQIRISDLDQDAFERNILNSDMWIHQQWQNIHSTDMTEVTW
jgi:surface protein